MKELLARMVNVNEAVTVKDKAAVKQLLDLLIEAQDLSGRAFHWTDEDRNSDEDIYNSISDVIGMVEYLLGTNESKKKVNEEVRAKEYDEKHNALVKILMDNGCAEYGDSIVDDICELFGYPLTPVDYEEEPYVGK